MASKSDNIIAFQGLPGAYSDLACRAAQPTMTTLPCPSFEDAFAAVKNGDARLAMIPIENSLAGRVADIHHLLPEAGLHIIGEHFQRVNHCLMAPKGATLAGLKTVESHVQALSQCRNFTVAQFYADIDGHPDQRPVRLALEELSFFSREVRILGVYPANPFRAGQK